MFKVEVFHLGWIVNVEVCRLGGLSGSELVFKNTRVRPNVLLTCGPEENKMNHLHQEPDSCCYRNFLLKSHDD